MELKEQKLQQFEVRQVMYGLVSLVIFGLIMYLGSTYIGLENIREKIDAAGIFGPFIFILLKISTVVFAPMSGTPLYLVAEPLFGFTKGFIYAFNGDIIAYTTVFYIARVFGTRIIKRLLPDKGLVYINTILDRIGTWKGLTITRLLLHGMADIISYAAGLTKMPYWQYILVTIPMIIANIIILMILGQAFINNRVMVYIAVGGLIISVVTYLLYQRIHKQKL